MCAQPQPGAALSAEEQRDLDDRLYTAAEGGDAAAVERLAGEGASADAKDEDGSPAVMAAAMGHAEAGSAHAAAPEGIGKQWGGLLTGSSQLNISKGIP